MAAAMSKNTSRNAYNLPRMLAAGGYAVHATFSIMVSILSGPSIMIPASSPVALSFRLMSSGTVVVCS